jgi:hypothetical protein
MNAAMRNVIAQYFDGQLKMAGDKVIVVYFFSPSCRECKTLHFKVNEHKQAYSFKNVLH